jgi:hypothetical protein
MEDGSPVEMRPCYEYSIANYDTLCGRGTLWKNSRIGGRNLRTRVFVIFSLATGLAIRGRKDRCYRRAARISDRRCRLGGGAGVAKRAVGMHPGQSRSATKRGQRQDEGKNKRQISLHTVPGSHWFHYSEAVSTQQTFLAKHIIRSLASGSPYAGSAWHAGTPPRTHPRGKSAALHIHTQDYQAKCVIICCIVM